jgi:hypothetical protein
MSYVGQRGKIEDMPRFVVINVYAQAEGLYSSLVTKFEVQLASEITIETKFNSGVINLNKSSRT